MKFRRILGTCLIGISLITLGACNSDEASNEESTTEANTTSTTSDTVSTTVVDTTTGVELSNGVNLAQSVTYEASSDALSYEKMLVAACEVGMNATICVENYQTVVTSYTSGWGPGAQTTTKKEHTLLSFGSGVIYYKAETTTEGEYLYKVITNEHVISADDYNVVEGEEEYIIYDENYDEELELELIGSDADIDIAVLSFVSDRDYTAVTFESEENVKVGSSVIAVGTPIDFAYYNTCTYGIISKITSSFIQHNASINSGNSGGPLFNLSGSLVGINNAKLSGSTSSGTSIEGIYFAIPLSLVSKAIISITGVNDIVYA